MNSIESFVKGLPAFVLLAIVAMTASCGDPDAPNDGGGGNVPIDGSSDAHASTDGTAVDVVRRDVNGEASADARANDAASVSDVRQSDASDVADARRADGATCSGSGNQCDLCGYANCCAEYSICVMDATCMGAVREYSACQADAGDGTACLDTFAKVSRIAENYAGCLVDSCDTPCRIQH